MAMCNDQGVLHYWWAICQSSGAVWGLSFGEESFSLPWTPARKQEEAKLICYPFPKPFHASLVRIYIHIWMFYRFMQLSNICTFKPWIYGFSKEQFQFTFPNKFCLCRLQTSCITLQIKGSRVDKSIDTPLPLSLFNIRENPFLVLLMSLYVVLLKPAWTESVSPVQNVNNVFEIQISELAALNERLACLLTQMAKWLIPDCKESVKQGHIQCSTATGYTHRYK